LFIGEQSWCQSSGVGRAVAGDPVDLRAEGKSGAGRWLPADAMAAARACGSARLRFSLKECLGQLDSRDLAACVEAQELPAEDL